MSEGVWEHREAVRKRKERETEKDWKIEAIDRCIDTLNPNKCFFFFPFDDDRA